MRILIISQYFSPDITAAAFRIGETADILAENGHSVSVICAKPHRSKGEEGDADGNYPVKRIGILPLNKGGMAAYILHYFSFVIGAIFSGIGIVRRFKPDIVWTTSPPLFVGIAGVCLSRLAGAPLVLDIRDIWPDSAAAVGQIGKGGTAFRMGRILEKWLYRRAAAITCVAQPMAQYLVETAQRPDVTVIYNGPRRSALPQQETSLETRTTKTLLYAGNLGHAQGLDVLVSAFDQVAQTGAGEGWELEIIGSGAVEAELKSQAASGKSSNRIRFTGALNKAAALKKMASANLLFLNIKSDEAFELTIPSKIFDYMLTGVPVLAGIAGEGAQVLGQSGGNVLFKPSDHDELCRQMENAFRDVEQLEMNARNNKRIVLENYSREASTGKLEQLFYTLSGQIKP
jgi:glycosyltransferase involved in cell wall biosynthesis